MNTRLRIYSKCQYASVLVVCCKCKACKNLSPSYNLLYRLYLFQLRHNTHDDVSRIPLIYQFATTQIVFIYLLRAFIVSLALSLARSTPKLFSSLLTSWCHSGNVNDRAYIRSRVFLTRQEKRAVEMTDEVNWRIFQPERHSKVKEDARQPRIYLFFGGRGLMLFLAEFLLIYVSLISSLQTYVHMLRKIRCG